MQPMPGGPIGGYEFTPMENQVIQKVGSRASTWGMISLVVGGLLVVMAIAIGVAGLIVAKGDARAIALAAAVGLLAFAVQPLVSGKWYRDAGTALNDVVQTQGNDIELMMRAIGKLRGAFTAEAIAAILGFVLGIVAAFAIVSQKG